MADCSSNQYDEANESASAEQIRQRLRLRTERLEQEIKGTPFGLQGIQASFHGAGGMYNTTYKSPEFLLEPGVVVIKVEHGGRGECHLQFAPTDAGWGYLISALTVGMAGPTVWVVVDYEDEAPKWGICRVSDRNGDPRTCMRPGKYSIEVKSTTKWSCHLMQPAIGQSREGFPHRFATKSGGAVAGTFRVGDLPVSANIQFSGNTQMRLGFFSLDGAHELLPDVPTNECRFHLKELELLPGKEYLMCGFGDGAWGVELSECY